MMKYAINSNKNLIKHHSSEDTPELFNNSENELKVSGGVTELNPGDIAIHDGLVIHCSEVNKSNRPSEVSFLITGLINAREILKNIKFI